MATAEQIEMQVAVPAGVGPGTTIQVQSPTGQMLQIVVPPNVTGPATITVQAPIEAMDNGIASPGTALSQELAKHRKISGGRPDLNFEGGKVSGSIPVNGESDELIATVRFSAENPRAHRKVQVFAADGTLWASWETPCLNAVEGAPIHITVGSIVYATCTLDLTRQVGCCGSKITAKVSRGDGSGGTILDPIDTSCMLKFIILAVITWLCVIGIFFMVAFLCLGCCARFTGKASSLDGSKAYPPHSQLREIQTLQFVPPENDKQKGTYAEVDSMTKLDLFIAMTVVKVVTYVAAEPNAGAAGGGGGP